jgi:hypothetical protein
LFDERKDEKPRDVIGITIADNLSYPSDPATFPGDTIGTRSDMVLYGKQSISGTNTETIHRLRGYFSEIVATDVQN